MKIIVAAMIEMALVVIAGVLLSLIVAEGLKSVGYKAAYTHAAKR